MAYRRTNIEVDLIKLEKAKRISGCRTAKEVVDYSLDRLIRSSHCLKEILKLRGEVHFDPNYDYKAGR